MSIYGSTDPNKTSTIEEFIIFKNDETISYHNMSFRDKYDDISYPIKNVLDDYIDELKELTVDVILNDNEYRKYSYKPRILANDIYDNPDLDFVILAINGICNVKEFNSRKIKLVKLDDLLDFMTTIFNANKEDIDIYNSNQNS